MFISPNQAIDLWDELVDCYYDSNGYGGTVAEIYIHTMMEHSNTYAHNPQSTMCEDESRNACQALYAICKKFESRYKCAVVFEGGEPLEILKTEPLSWRIHLKVVKEED